MSAYTKGPWEVADDGMIRQVGDRRLWISSPIDIPSRDGGDEATIANSRIQASAPELLEALKEICSYRMTLLDDSDNPPDGEDLRYFVEKLWVMWQKADAAIAKAGGK